ncbi:OLC1v1011897C2 [Oldenlandia corymbosa var. corymbosa]|nr:OLC1v1011897C2 [Oldenlandia corymbosa var. corymbosa]
MGEELGRRVVMALLVAGCLWVLLTWGVVGGGVEAVRTINVGSSAPHITVMGMVYCDICYNNSFSTHSFFLPGVEVRIDCKFKAHSATTSEDITFSVNRSTNRYGIYKLQIGSVDGVNCAAGFGNSCRATLLSPSTAAAACSVPGSTTTSDEITIESTLSNTCIYSLTALNYRPPSLNLTLCPPPY